MVGFVTGNKSTKMHGLRQFQNWHLFVCLIRSYYHGQTDTRAYSLTIRSMEMNVWICVEKNKQLDVTVCFTALMIRSTCFGHFYAHLHELKTICMLLAPMVCSAWLLAVGVRCRAAGCSSRKGNAAAFLFLDAHPFYNLTSFLQGWQLFFY